MSDAKTCPKCSGSMVPGTLRERVQYGGASPYVWAPANDVPFPVKGAPTTRREITIYRCEGCGYLEMYAAPAGGVTGYGAGLRPHEMRGVVGTSAGNTSTRAQEEIHGSTNSWGVGQVIELSGVAKERRAIPGGTALQLSSPW